MPRFYPSVLISDAYGSVGEVTFYHRNGKCYYRKRSHSRYPGTAAQTSALDVHRRALAAWREVPHQMQLIWNRLAEEVEPHRPPFDHLTHITGQNLFVSAYHGFVTLRDEHGPLPAPGLSEEFPGGGRLLLWSDSRVCRAVGIRAGQVSSVCPVHPNRHCDRL